MRTTITIIATILSGLLILDSFNAGQALLMFVLAGQLPGTSIALSASTMLEAYLVIAGFVSARLVIAAAGTVRSALLKRQTA